MIMIIAGPLRITIEGAHPPSPNQRLHALTRFRVVRPLAASAYWQARALAPAQPYERVTLLARFVYPRTRPQMRDPDNCVASLKEIVDAVVRAGLVVDDGPGRIDLQVVQQIGERRRLVLEVTPRPA
jgi:Holliday junction resolvase RusA-like endonuclease